MPGGDEPGYEAPYEEEASGGSEKEDVGHWMLAYMMGMESFEEGGSSI